MNKYFLFLAITFASLCEAENSLKILSYQTDPMPVLDKNAKFIKNVAVAELPAPEVAVTFFDEENELVKVVDKDGTEFWFDSFDLELNKGKVVALPCVKLASNAANNATQAGTLGYGKSCNKG
ncbi:hypothetical protein [Cognaticolwellia mytili]|uniref:hypothetical protein n=1 Tax=Cognaticolwellia mytili TaxID=1888913 RepID=UPI000A1708E9|nr:hypothetical protein [Cognaticolwellia mytili]